MAVLAIGAQKFLSLTSGAALNAEKLRKALAASQGAEQLRKQFEVLGLSAEQARKKVEGVAKVASGSAFSFESLATAAKNLQVLGGSALSTAGMLRKVQDVAAATGSPVDNVATAIGEMYAALERGGSGAGAAAAQLASMGAISQATAQKISEISAAGGPAADSLRAMQGDLGKASGASAQMASSLSGLQAQLANLQNANDIKIGDMFLEGEKAGYRAAIAMEKLRGKVDEVASAPFAAIIGQVAKLKETFANIVGSDTGIEAIKGLFTFLSTMAVAAVGVIAAQVLQFIGFLGGLAVSALKTAAGVKTLSGALSFAGGALKNWATLLASATVRMNLYAAAITLVVGKVLEARAAIDAMADAQKELNQTNAKELGGLKQKRLMVSTSEEKQAAMKDFDAAISANDGALANAKKERDDAAAEFEQKNSYSYNLNPLNWVDSITGGNFTAAEKLKMKEQQVQSIQNQGIGLRGERGRLAAMDSTTLGLDSEQDKRERDKLRLEDDIRKNSRQRVAAMASPAQASGLIESELYDAEGKLQRSEKASQRSFEERGNLYTAQAGALVAGDAGTKDFSANGYSDSLDAMKQVDTQTESGRLSKDLAIRETLRNERASTEGAIAQQAGLGAAADPETRKRLLEKQNVINAQIQAIGGEGEISGRRTQELQRDRERAMEKEDPVKARQEVEAVKARKQQVDEAKAADKSSIDAGNRKLALENRLAAIKGLEGGEGKAVEMQGDEELNSLKDRLQATQEVEKATAKFNASSAAERPQAEKELDSARIAAKGKGFQDGDTMASVNLEISGVKQITELRKQQAAIEQAAAQRRRDDIMNEIKAANMINQIRVNRLDTKMGNSDANGFNEKKIAEQQQKTNNAGRGLEVAKTVEKLDAQIGGLQDKLKANPDDEEAKSQLDLAQKSKATFEATLGKMFPSGDVSVKGMQKNLDQERKNLEQVKNAPKTERDVQRDELKRQGGDLEKAKGAAEERDAAIKAMDGATSDKERKRLSDVAAKKKEEMTSLGVDEGASVQSISKKISQNKQEQQNMLGEDVVNRASVEQDLKLTIARTKEDYGVTREDREQGRKERKDLEDVETKKSLKEQYERMGYKGGKDGEAEKLAEFDTKRKRLQADADEAGNSRVDSFTAIGGGATNSVGVVKDIQKEILDINKQQQDLLDKILQESLAQKALVQGYQPDSPGM